MNTIEQIKAELKGKQIIVISENDGIANIKWDCRSLDDVKALLASAQSFIADKQVEELRGIGSGPDYNTTEGRYRNAHKFQHEHPEVNLEEEADKWRHHHFAGQRDGWYSGEYLTRESQLDIARHFAEWQKNKMLEKAICTEVGITCGIPSIWLALKDCKQGDTVKVIIIKED